MLKKLIFWEYPRASWQWDVIVALILAFIFLTPRSWFNDQPRANQVAMMSAGRFFVDPAALSGLDEAQKLNKVRDLIEKRYREKVRITQIEPVVEENEVRGYVVSSTQ
jgi:hypothetical protein